MDMKRNSQANAASIGRMINGRRVLVTGAGGSIGSEICRAIMELNPHALVALDRDDSRLHEVITEITRSTRNRQIDLQSCVADICDMENLRQKIKKYAPDTVIHAAALKQVPILEEHPDEAFRVNVIGTSNLLEVCASEIVQTFVNISTDKAANPVTVLGKTKRLAERMTAHYGRSNKKRYLSIRFGNVMWSRASVLHTFAEQIANGGPVTVTHPDVTRYLMTIEEAVDLALYAASQGRSGETLVLDMGAPIRIDDLARRMIKESENDVPIEYIGLRPGEKLHEQLWGEGDSVLGRIDSDIIRVEVEPLSKEDACGEAY
ncbi:SDR family NAD(P)-dependent oxidoreductase [Streptomyces sp. VNUA24]|uniref:SDR family NAD(P)-dependent oxidoreductase n=1 Tax=Streptomyces sp. VNUA24 TaxID=3031131 RepID=UPI0023B7907C|nr:SDR family NAD(P)-dependent oxidoreductase [Streptomyces sp. VNUA24]WEH18440.1 SDR family NAD(P)-dependent oxidoreductase [Streptomyces sp. VNUA24]